MFRRILNILGLGLLLFSQVASAQPKEVAVRILQEDSVYSPNTAPLELLLRKKSFKIQVMLQNIKGVYAFASRVDTLYRWPDGKTIPKFDMLPSMVMAEDAYNREKELLVSEDGWCYWYYDPRTGIQGFNRKFVTVDSGQIVGTKSIKQLYFLPSRRIVKVKDISGPVYLFIVAVDQFDSEGRPIKELMRWKVKLDWVEEDD
jgi:hypothetical protein